MAVTATVPGLASSLIILDWANDTIKCALVTSLASYAQDTTDYWSDLEGSEVANGLGYATAVFRLRNPAGTTTTPVVTTDTPDGAYYVDVTVPRAAASEGRWSWRWEGSGVVTAAAEGYFEVLDSALD